MNLSRLARRFTIRGVFWRQLLQWATQTVPHFMEPLLLAIWTLFFFVLWGPGRRDVYRNLKVISPPAPALVILARAYRVFWNFACTFTDTMQFNVRRMRVDWIIEGSEHFDELRNLSGGAIILTAHLGNYDIGSYLFAERTGRQLVIVRAAEADPESDQFAKEHRRQLSESIGIGFTDPSGNIVIGLVQALQRGEVVAIQGDRVLKGTPAVRSQMFGRSIELPAGPFALAQATRAPIFPMFIARTGRRQYRVIALEPIRSIRRTRDRDADLQFAIDQWAPHLEGIIRRYWFQWFTFFPFFEKEES